MTPKRREKVLAPVRPNAGVESWYRQKLDELISEMSRSYLWFIRAQYRDTPPWMAQDATPAQELNRELQKLGARWEAKFDEAAPKLARYFTLQASKRSEVRLKKILRDGGISVRFQMTPAMRDIAHATVQANVSLIKSIGSQYHAQVETLVMQSVTTGRDLKTLTDELQARYGVTRRRAAFIALDQNNKTTSAFNRARSVEAGLFTHKWLHSHADKVPRPTHLKMDGKEYDIRVGMYDPAEGRYIQTGELIRCSCQSRAVVRGFS